MGREVRLTQHQKKQADPLKASSVSRVVEIEENLQVELQMPISVLTNESKSMPKTLDKSRELISKSNMYKNKKMSNQLKT